MVNETLWGAYAAGIGLGILLGGLLGVAASDMWHLVGLLLFSLGFIVASLVFDRRSQRSVTQDVADDE
ncbi:hypothetical protein SAMN04488063_2285 [Halopelagius inordinatus]|uniref:Uncharacterized protein n=1 Tax=Halopelagius inordinatus TaxID=553467 RepID=A0A1I2SFV4_9EURY|nr:hypothetical protein [Halopelagius inordinatus]SFG51714.1 hypothetical protein SAMN04488063_2285 [Halopelagius inordinatus]